MNVSGFEEFQIDLSKEFFIIDDKVVGNLEESEMILSKYSPCNDVFLFRTLASQAISIANSIVPGEAETLIELAGLNNVISTQSSSITSTSDDQLIKRMIEVYKALEQKKYPFIERVQLLAILPESMSNKEIMERFGCSRYETYD